MFCNTRLFFQSGHEKCASECFFFLVFMYNVQQVSYNEFNFLKLGKSRLQSLT